MNDPVNHPAHYTNHPSGVECIQITEHMNFCIGNAIKYAWRAGLKTEDPIQDLEKAIWYLQREVDRLRSEQASKRIEEAQPVSRGVWDRVASEFKNHAIKP